jgi:hypothetical protein
MALALTTAPQKPRFMLGGLCLCLHMSWCFGGAVGQSKRLSPLRSWVRFLLWTHVKRVSEHSAAESRGFSPSGPVFSYRASSQGGLR